MKRKLTSLGFGLAVAGLLLGACSSSPSASSSTSKPPQQLTDISFAYAAPIAAFAPEEIIAANQSFCDPYGVHVTVSDLSASLISNALVSGEVPVVITASSSLMLAAAQAPSSQVVLGTGGPFVYDFYGSPNTQTISQVAGTSVGATAKGSGTDVANRAVLKEYGITNFKTTYAGNGPAMLALLANNTVSALAYPPPIPTQITADGVHVLKNLATDPNVSPFLLTPVVVNRQFFNSHLSAVKGVLKCIVAADTYAHTNKASTISIIESITKSTAAEATVGYNDNKGAWQLFPWTVSLANKVKTALIQDGLAPTLQSFDPSSIINTQVVKTINGALTAPPAGVG